MNKKIIPPAVFLFLAVAAWGATIGKSESVEKIYVDILTPTKDNPAIAMLHDKNLKKAYPLFYVQTADGSARGLGILASPINKQCGPGSLVLLEDKDGQ